MPVWDSEARLVVAGWATRLCCAGTALSSTTEPARGGQRWVDAQEGLPRGAEEAGGRRVCRNSFNFTALARLEFGTMALSWAPRRKRASPPSNATSFAPNLSTHAQSTCLRLYWRLS